MMSANSQSTANGIATPIAAPASAPASATMRNSTSRSATTLAPLAPIAFRIASVARFRSTKPCAALATPTPPTTSDRSPARVRNSAKRSRSRLKSGDTLRRERASQPASGKAAFGFPNERLDGRFVRRAARSVHDHARRPADERPRLHQSGRVQRRVRNQHPRPEADADRQPVGLAGHDGAQDERGLAEAKCVADLELEAREQRLLGDGAERRRRFPPAPEPATWTARRPPRRSPARTARPP